jgi:hypothetical protein
MATVTVKFRRTVPGTMTVNFWIRDPRIADPQHSWKKLIFDNGADEESLDTGIHYVLFWDAFGREGDEFVVERQILGTDQQFQPLHKWKIPDDPQTPPGVPVRFREKTEFTL